MQSGLTTSNYGALIFLLRGKKVIIDADLALLYEVPTKALKQQVKRNPGRFPTDFMFELTGVEKQNLVTNCDRLANLRHSSVNPMAFTEQGVAMLSGILNSERAIAVNIAIMRAFVQLRKFIETNKELVVKIGELEKMVSGHDENIRLIFETIGQLIEKKNELRTPVG